MLGKHKVAIVYDWIDKWGGVERVLLIFHEIFPKADFFTSYYNPDKAKWARNINVKTSFIQKLPKIIKNNRILSLLFYPIAFETFNFNDYDLVISITSSFAKSIITQPSTKHICYLLTPTRFLWSHQKDYIKNEKSKNKIFTDYLKNWDKTVAQRPDKIISISETVKKRCKKYYQRESEVIYPPFDTDYWQKIKLKITNLKSQIKSKFKILNSKFYLVVSRLEPYKKVDLAIKVFNKLNKNLIIVGEGTQEDYLKQIAKKNNNIIFFSKLTDLELGYLYSKAEALIMPQEEDFGYVSLEGQFFGCPVIAYKKGGVVETIIDKKTGIFFDRQTVESLTKAVERFKKIKYNLRQNVLKYGINNIMRFNKKNWINLFKKIIDNL